jgi:hypothetical protein
VVQLCVLLWARPGAVEALVAYEDRVLALLSDHDGELVQRARTIGEGDAPTEVQLITFRSQAGLDAYMADGRRLALSADRDAAIARTEVYPVEIS